MLRLQECDKRLMQLVRDTIRRHCIFENLLEVVCILLVKDPLSYDHPGVAIQAHDQVGPVLLPVFFQIRQITHIRLGHHFERCLFERFTVTPG